MKTILKTLGVSAAILLSQASYANLPYFPVEFPRDEAAHHKNVPYQFDHLIEWWYFNGVVTTDDGKHLGYDVAVFNAAVNMGNVMTRPMLHLQVADLDQKKSYGVAKNYTFNVGKFSTDKLEIVLDKDYSLTKETRGGKEVYVLKAEGKTANTTLKFDLVLEPRSKPILINKNGMIPMPDETNSYYYSMPHFNATGSIQINQDTHQISKKAGDSWKDHQWGDFNPQAYGWEWFSVRLENGLDANIFLNVEYKNHQVLDGYANVVLPNGEHRVISYKDMKVTRDNYWHDQNVGVDYPLTFTISIPELGLELKNEASFAEQELHHYWEGYCNVSAVYQKQAVKGYSYTELVYQSPAGLSKNITM